ncbi:MAG: hypothetical protein QG588_1023 [Candidatus Poribacteria bacterium]|nr:hypothetical protein [Candidatus Poribacteria bacterium]
MEYIGYSIGKTYVRLLGVMNGLEGIKLNTKNPLYRVMLISLTATPLLMSERQGVESDQNLINQFLNDSVSISSLAIIAYPSFNGWLASA